jgi:hypothetical protein
MEKKVIAGSTHFAKQLKRELYALGQRLPNLTLKNSCIWTCQKQNNLSIHA